MRALAIVAPLLLAGCLDLDASHYRFTREEVDGGDGADAGTSSSLLAGLTPSVGFLVPDFSPTTTSYTVAVSPSIQSVTLTATLDDPTASLEVEGVMGRSGVPSQPLALVQGTGRFELMVRADAGTTSYEVQFVEKLPEQRERFEGAGHFGTAVALSGDTLAVGAYGDSGAAGAVTIYVREGATWMLQQVLRASNANAMDQFGRSLALEGDTLVVGAPVEDSAATTVNGDQADNTMLNAGAAYVFVRDGNVWSQQAYLKPPDTAVELRFGSSVALSGDLVAAGARGAASAGALTGAVYTFTRSGTSWAQQQVLVASNAAASAAFGTSVALQGTTLVVGAPNESTGGSQSGAVYVFTRSASWVEQRRLKANDVTAYALFGQSVALDGDSLAIGADGSGGSLHHHQGTAYVFVRAGATWSEQQRITPAVQTDEDEFGWSVALAGNTLAVGAWQESSSSTGVNGAHDAAALYAGAGYVFSRSGTSWTERAFLKASVTRPDDYLGASVALTPSFLAVGGDSQVCLFSSP